MYTKSSKQNTRTKTFHAQDLEYKTRPITFVFDNNICFTYQSMTSCLLTKTIRTSQILLWYLSILHTDNFKN